MDIREATARVIKFETGQTAFELDTYDSTDNEGLVNERYDTLDSALEDAAKWMKGTYENPK